MLVSFLTRSVAIAFFMALLTLSALCQTYDIFFRPAKTIRSDDFYAYCYTVQQGQTGQQLVNNCQVDIVITAYNNTGGHFHNDNRPKSKVICQSGANLCNPNYFSSAISGNTGTIGYIALSLTTGRVSQAEKITATSNGGGSSLDYVVGWTDIYYNHHPEIWMPIGGSDTGGGTGHSTTDFNRWMMSSPAYGLYYATLDYLADHPGQGKICTNDMALPFGGKFDINKTWATPHTSHDRGTAADIAATANQCLQQYVVDVAEFIQKCVGRAAHWNVPHSDHAHCGWVDPITFPH